ncbi:cysteine hydrolase family protein [Henriciella sp.]|uniref:cysteine hydrolase family protein n=1 Tax=Henriciella sp. TaxID=1968823 RepID=UPI002626DF35|nr:isochorismatase family cysteine hydrolase [Henriciella sp.]
MVSISARPFDWPYDDNLDPATTAILVIDMQKGFFASDGYLAGKGYDTSPMQTVIGTVSRLVKGARDTGCKVIWTRQGFRADAADASPYDKWRASRAGIQLDDASQTSLSRGTPGHQILPELAPHPSDIIVDKTANGAFYQTDLEMILRSQSITNLIFCGVTTDVCVHTTLREAVDRKYQCMLVEDACASGDQYAHDAGVHMVTVEDGIFGVVASTDAVLDGFSKLGSSSADYRRSGVVAGRRS